MRKTVLHIEDDPCQQKLVRVVLESIGRLAVQTAADGFEAVEMAMENAPHLVLLDEGLPGMSGSLTYAALRKVAGLRGVPVIFLTGSTDPRTHGNLIGLGAHDILVKPCRPQLLVNAVQLALEGH
jgi:DNA-binding response OmpR family regulator